MAAGRKRRTVYRKRRQNKFSMFLVTLVVVMILVVVAVKRVEIEAKMEVNQAKIEQLNGQIASEEARAEEIKQYEKYTQTKGFVEEIAHDKLGLVYEGEIIFRKDK
ncbi:MAG: septum formation initiator family protein [Lachnospiraceae bacterium]|nr:septum formation initiator family protein [Lachnospiraceae bacterium]MBD5511886.1 septum formation initiator family protein [Lachnospiraceae bacterium]